MNDCKEILELLSAYLDLELSTEACSQIDRHLAGCTACDEFAASLRKTVNMCREYEPRTLPGPISQAARAELEAAWKKVLASGRAPDSKDTA